MIRLDKQKIQSRNPSLSPTLVAQHYHKDYKLNNVARSYYSSENQSPGKAIRALFQIRVEDNEYRN
jgi:hypothetical protein